LRAGNRGARIPTFFSFRNRAPFSLARQKLAVHTIINVPIKELSFCSSDTGTFLRRHVSYVPNIGLPRLPCEGSQVRLRSVRPRAKSNHSMQHLLASRIKLMIGSSRYSYNRQKRDKGRVLLCPCQASISWFMLSGIAGCRVSHSKDVNHRDVDPSPLETA
jgi:hypothetical protein